MTDIRDRIAAALEREFVRNGFAQTGVDALRDAAQVSLRTLYKYCPSREAMILMALERRHQRYLAFLFAGLPEDHAAALRTVFNRISTWMRENASHGCLFHAAVAAHPDSAALRKLLEDHKRDVAERLAEAFGMPDHATDLILVHEGLTQSWPLLGDQAVESAKALALRLSRDARAV